MSSAQVLIMQHAPWEKPGRILENLEDLDLPTLTLNVAKCKKPDLPDLSQISGLVVMGGPMGPEDIDAFPGLQAEKKLIRSVIKAEMPVLGVCLGQQLISTALGGKVIHGKELKVGFRPVKSTEKNDYFAGWSKQQPVLQWHQDSVSLPKGAQLLAKSQHIENQAFRIGTALGLLFHLEVTATLLDEWLSEKSMVKAIGKSQAARIRDDFETYNPQVQPLAEQVFSAFAARCKTYGQSRTCTE
ncbi:GMP synthase [Bifidobacterium aemilianum]|uniref:GMP synthase n=1 Tax=Bifidobacterium aemilianum TaxID=2493120 RepID=A0A366K6P3_9BIFI|nr:type 1 glutamine amidotransferase [Bifidobacterium aemilianum]RBP97416.1 GMP synthase [Bifidobacterium aemilianum]